MFCTKCGNPSVNTKFCPKCGNPVRQVSAVPVQPGAPVKRVTHSPLPPQCPAAKPFSTPMPGMDTIVRDAATQKADGSSIPQPEDAPPPRKIRAVFTEYETGTTSFFGTIYHFVNDRSKFFMRADMDREVGKATLIMIFANICVGIGDWGALALMGAKANISPHRILLWSVISLLKPFLLSLLGMLVMSITYRALVSWKRIYCIYAFSSIVYILCLIPLRGRMIFIRFFDMKFICAILFCIAAKSGFENVFGLDDGPAWFFALGLPIILFVIIFFFAAGALIGAAVGLPQLMH